MSNLDRIRELAGTSAKPKRAGIREALPEIGPALMGLLGSAPLPGQPMRPLQGPNLEAKGRDIVMSPTDPEADARARARALLEPALLATIPGPPGTGLAASAAFSGINSALAGASEAAMSGRPMAPAALTSGLIGAAIPPAFRGMAALRGIGRAAAPEVAAEAAPAVAATDPTGRLIEALKAAKPLRGRQAEINRSIRASRIGRFQAVGEKASGRKGAAQQMAQLKGEFQKVEFEPLQLSAADEDALYDAVKGTLKGYDLPTGFTALRKLLGNQGGAVPTSGEIDMLDKVFGPAFTQAVLAKRAGSRKFGEAMLEAGGAIKSVTATADLSAALRQGAPLISTSAWRRAFKDMFRFARSEQAVQQLDEQIAARPTYTLMRESGLALTHAGRDLAQREERFVSNLIEEVPVYGKLARASNRAYTGFLNQLRADTFDAIVRDAERMGHAPQDIAEKAAHYVNTMTGRGGLGAAERSAKLLNAGFFSPRFVAARLSQLNPATYLAQPAPVRKAALRNLLGAGSLAMTTFGLARLAGAKIGVDPRNADFGKLRVGNTRFDVLGGVQQPVRLAAQLVSGKAISSTTGKEMRLGEGYKATTRFDIVTRFLENKEAPLVSLASTLLKGQTHAFQEIGMQSPAASDALASEVAQRFVPLFVQDAVDVVKEWGPTGAAMAVPGAFGIGIQTYGPPASTAPNLERIRALSGARQ